MNVRAVPPTWDCHVTHVRGNRYACNMSGVTFYQLHPCRDEWLDAERFFRGDAAKEGMAVTVKGPFRRHSVQRPDGFEVRVTFFLILHAG